eukprot:TRINITY_DN2849_c0_g1_i2.p1 TRINITY_DN2849_c0_g1~~TRINITY_DN2849_c0_g1_i2.p1  ORF type:complete len:260 (-),score=35.12 TRINITY_DN2849_c0_g1_i2:81-860(-)
MKKMMIFSRTAVINYEQTRYVGGIDQVEHGTYQPGDRLAQDEGQTFKDRNCPCLVFRMANISKSQLCSTQLRLLLIQRPRKPSLNSSKLEPEHSFHFKDIFYNACENLKDTPGEIRFIQDNDLGGEEIVISELNFELNRQIGRVRSVNLSAPLLPLPWLVVHPMDRSSPLYGYTSQKLAEMRCEIIPVMEGISEAVSDSFQARYSYIANEITWNAKYNPIISTTPNGKYVVDFSKFHDIVPVFSSVPVGSSEVSQEMIF